VDGLSDRELEVFQLIGRGLGTGEIARQLHLSPKTIETYRAHIKNKMNLESATELLQHAIQYVQSLRSGT
jgi:DNA-binding CsgD family transcriptional regulator